MRLAEISDSDQALKMLREIKQKKDENVQCYAERLLSLPTEAYSGQQGGVRAADRSRGVFHRWFIFRLSPI